MKWYHILLYSLLGGLLLGTAWYPYGLPFLVFFGLIPFIFISDRLLQKGKKLNFWRGLVAAYPGMVLWNAITTYWIANISVPGCLFAVLVNALLMSMTFALWHACRKWIPSTWAHPIMFAAFWITFEHLHLSWELTWPWLTLGNIFAVCPEIVQWYCVTGALGGSLWIIIVNFLFYYLIKAFRKDRKKSWALAGSVFLCLLIPIVISGIQYKTYAKRIDKSTPVEVVVVQPHTDTYDEEFYMSNLEHAMRTDSIIAPLLTQSTNLVLMPESVIPHTVMLQYLVHNNPPNSPSAYGFYQWIDSLTNIYPHLNFIAGLSTYDLFDHPTGTAKKVSEHLYGEHYNTAMCFNANGYNGHYHKCKLVPGTEAFPYPQVFGFLEELMIDLGGSNGTLGKDSTQKVFTLDVNGKPLKVGTAICYESIYGDLVRNFAKKGAGLLTVITNDSWWGDTPGHFQHYEMSRLRAVENRRYVVRAANGGNSAIIDPLGNALVMTDYGVRTAVPYTVYAQSHITFYSKHGDYIARTMLDLFAIFLCLVVLRLAALVASREKNKEH